MTDNFERIRKDWLHSKMPPQDLRIARADIAWLVEELELQYRIVASQLVTNSEGQSWKERAEAAEAELEAPSGARCCTECGLVIQGRMGLCSCMLRR
jgi:hypothetical protein